MMTRALVAAAGIATCAATAHGAIFFTFSDPVGARQVTYSENPGSMFGSMSYSSDAVVNLIVDGSEEGMPAALVYETRLEMNISVGQATALPNAPGAFASPLFGNFIFYQQFGGPAFATGDPRGEEEILRGTFDSAIMLTVGGAGALITTSENQFGLSYTASGALLDQINAVGIPQLFGFKDAVFTLTDVLPTLSIGDSGRLTDFTANAAYTGTAEVPAPGAVGLLALSGLAAARRRRR